VTFEAAPDISCSYIAPQAREIDGLALVGLRQSVFNELNFKQI
jgi:hypothetical protein